MSRISGSICRFFHDVRGVVTIEWVAVTATFVVFGIIFIVYPIFGDEDGGLVAIVNSKQEQLSDRVNDVDNMLTEVNAWTPSGS